MMGCRSRITKLRAPVWRASITLLAASATLFVAIPGANAATADRPLVITVQSAAPPVQSCDDAYDQTGVRGAGIGQIRAVENGFYSFSVAFNEDFIAAHPPTTDFLWGEARIFVNGSYAFSISVGHPRPLNESFHSLIKLQGYKYGRRNRQSIQRGDLLSFRISLLLIDPVSGTFYPGHGTISCRL
jgi:hypothetical protein